MTNILNDSLITFYILNRYLIIVCIIIMTNLLKINNFWIIYFESKLKFNNNFYMTHIIFNIMKLLINKE